MMGRLAGKNAVVTGGARGLGLAIATALAAEGAELTLIDLLGDVHEAAEKLAANLGRPVRSYRCDITEQDSINTVFEQLDSHGVPYDVLMNGAGVANEKDALEMTRAEFEFCLDVNVTGMFMMCQRFAKGVIARGGTASIVNISSMSGYVVNVPQPVLAYNVSKAAAAMLTQALGVEWIRKGIRVNAVAPGYFVSDMTRDYIVRQPEIGEEWRFRTPIGRFGQPDELGPLVVYLASDESGYVVGQNILIDGGYTAV